MREFSTTLPRNGEAGKVSYGNQPREKQELDARTITLHDGRHAYVDGDNYRDNGRLLQGKDLEEALSRNCVSKPPVEGKTFP